MYKKSILIFILLSFTILLLSNCANKQSCDKPKYTMAIDSELTLLMRDMYNYYDSVKSEVVDGSLDEDIKTFTEIHKAVATSPEKTLSPLYQAFATNYIQSVNHINQSDKNRKDAFNLMVDNCMNCHQQMCPGPMVRIKKLYIE